MSGIVQSTEETKEKEKEASLWAVGGEIVEVGKGTFLYGGDKREETIETSFWIDVYPVTNGQFEQFIKVGGYRDAKHWSPEGWSWREKENISKPGYWDDKNWNLP